jgi:hypothetical protein
MLAAINIKAKAPRMNRRCFKLTTPYLIDLR